MSDNKKSLQYSLIGAACAAGLGALGYFFYVKSNGDSSLANSNVKNLSRVTTIKVIKQLKKELFTSFSTMAMMAQQIKAQTRGRASEAEIKDFVMMHPQINEEFKSSEARAYKRHNVTDKEFENAVDNIFKNDEEVQAHRRELKSMFDKAASGAQLDIKAEIPQSLTSQNTLEIIEQIMKASCKKIQEVFAKLHEENGSVNMNDPQTLQALNSMKIDDVKANILESHGLENYDDPGAKILQYATSKYQQENPDGFTEKMMQLELKHRRSMELIQQNPTDAGIIDKVFSEPAQQESSMFGGMGGPGMGGMRIGNRTGKKNQDVVVGEKIVREEEKQQQETETENVKKTEEGEQQQESERQNTQENQSEKQQQESERQNTQENQSEKQQESERQNTQEQEQERQNTQENQQVVEETSAEIVQQEQSQPEEIVVVDQQEQEQTAQPQQE